MLVKHLLYNEKFTIDVDLQLLDHYRRTGALKSAARQAMRFETVLDVRRALDDVLSLLDGRPVTARVEPVSGGALGAAEQGAIEAPPPSSGEPRPRLANDGEEQLALG
jgi:hypothetical protein